MYVVRPSLLAMYLLSFLFVSMIRAFVGPADDSESVATGPDMSDLPDIPLSEALGLLVADLRSGQIVYRLSHVQSVIAQLFRAIGQAGHVYDAQDIDPYFRAVYKWFIGQDEDIQPSADALRSFWERYSKESRMLALFECMEKLKRVNDAHTEALEEFTEAATSFREGVIRMDDDAFQTAHQKLTIISREAVRFTELARAAAEARKFSD